MGFLFPLFLLAGLFLVAPLVIHLFNLRRYKHEYFPNLRFLQQIQLVSKRSRELKKKWLLLTRLLFVAALVIAFAQPYRNSKEQGTGGAAIKVVYLDNSWSMSIQNGAESLLQQAKNKAEDLVHSSAPDTRFLVLSNDRRSATRPLQPKAAQDAIRSITWSGRLASLNHVLGSIADAQDNEPNEAWEVYLFSDFQESGLNLSQAFPEKLPRTSFYLYPFQNKEVSNLFIDSAFLIQPLTGREQQNELVTRIKTSGKTGAIQNTLQIAVDGQVRGVKRIRNIKDSIWIDSTRLQLTPSAWQKITLSLQEDRIPFDDTFRIVGHTGTGLNVLILSEDAAEPYLLAAFENMPGIRLNQQLLQETDIGDWDKYSLIVLQNAEYFGPALEKGLRVALSKGQNVLLFPGKNVDKQRLNQSLKALVDIQLSNLDTSGQQVVSLQMEHPLIRGVFEKIPENIQLPLAAKRFPIRSGIAASQQAILSFRDGSPFLAQYRVNAGKLFLCASPLGDHYSDFPLSYFFVPLLYKMASQEQRPDNFSVTVGSDIPVRINKAGDPSGRRKTWHLIRPGFDAVPPAEPIGSGISIFAGKVADQADFYILRQEGGTDSLLVAMNIDNRESRLSYAAPAALERALKGYKISWLDTEHIQKKGWTSGSAPFPLWKIVIWAALICLLAETWFLIRPVRTLKTKV